MGEKDRQGVLAGEGEKALMSDDDDDGGGGGGGGCGCGCFSTIAVVVVFWVLLFGFRYNGQHHRIGCEGCDIDITVEGDSGHE